jgi:hypothetical protein
MDAWVATPAARKRIARRMWSVCAVLRMERLSS